MGSFSIFHWLIVLAVILILFGAGKLPNVAGDMAKAIKAFRSGLKEEDDAAPASTPPAAVAPPAVAPAPLASAAAPHTVEVKPAPHGQSSGA